MNFVDFCAGIGGFRLGLEILGGKSVYSCDIDEKCEETYFANFGTYFDAKDIASVEPDALHEYNIFCAGFPCQPFSIAGKRKGFFDSRSDVFDHIIRLIQESRPEVVFLENVKHLLYLEQGETIKTILRMLNEQGYYTKYKAVNSKYFGVPQSRERLYIVGFRSKEAYYKFSFPVEKEVTKTFKDIVDEGNGEHPLSARWLEYIELYSGRKSLNEMSFRVPKTRVKLEKKPDGVSLEECVLQMRSSGIRAIPVTEPFPTFAVSVSGGGAMIPVYVRERRHLNLLEMKRLMGFPDTYVFPVARTHAIKQLANAVPPPVVTKIGEKIIKAINSSVGEHKQRIVLQSEMYQQASLFS